MVVFPARDREASGAAAGERVTVTLELDSGYRHVDVPPELTAALETNNLTKTFHDLSYSKRKEFAHQVTEAKAEDTKMHHTDKFITSPKS